MKKLFLLFFVFLLMVSCVCAAQPDILISSSELGYELTYPLYNVFKQNQNYTFSFHVYNKSSGLPVVKNVVCYLHIYDVDHVHIYNQSQNTSTFEYDFDFVVDGGNFSDIGSYSYLVGCNDSSLGGFASVPFIVSYGVSDTTTAQSILYLGLLIIVLSLLSVLLFFAVSLDGRNKIQMGSLIEMNTNKYVKTSLYFLSYIFFICLTYLVWAISESLLWLNLASGLFRLFFTVAWIGVFPIIVLMMVKIIFDVVTDKELVKIGKRGLKLRGGKR